tara:strand:+ start:11171 stop:12007 length:837 start_codon:yes stop_codon:yes gene_type:complete
MKLTYLINHKKIVLDVPETQKFLIGQEICLSKKFDDLVIGTSFQEKGFDIINFDDIICFSNIKNSVYETIKKNIQKLYPKKNLKNFKLEKYHKFINEKEHITLDKKLKRQYPEDFGFSDKKIIKLIEGLIKKPLGYKVSNEAKNHWIIIRINMPKSGGFNPAHKDIYEDYDKKGFAPRMINCWIPVCGVNKNTGLPLVPGSHNYLENEIVRTKCNSIIENRQYSVNCIKSWQGKNNLSIMSPKYGEMILFSSHLIHGLGLNNNLDETRISLEFRLHHQ